MDGATHGGGATRRLILHIGAPKTGTSALQSAFSLNLEMLARSGIVYPDHPSLSRARRGEITSGNGIAVAKFLNPDALPTVRETPLLDDVESVRAAHPDSDLLYSSEWMSRFEPDRLQTLREYADSKGLKIELVMLVRPIGDHLVSDYHQHVKRHAFSGSLEEFCVDRGSRMPDTLRRVRQALPDDQVIIRNYESMKADLCARFFADCLRIDAPDLIRVDDTINRSLTRDELELLRVVNRFLDDNLPSTLVSNALLSAAGPAGGRLRITPAEYRTIETQLRDDHRSLSALLPFDMPLFSSVEVGETDGTSVDERDVWWARLVAELALESAKSRAKSQSRN